MLFLCDHTFSQQGEKRNENQNHMADLHDKQIKHTLYLFLFIQCYMSILLCLSWPTLIRLSCVSQA